MLVFSIFWNLFVVLTESGLMLLLFCEKMNRKKAPSEFWFMMIYVLVMNAGCFTARYFLKDQFLTHMITAVFGLVFASLFFRESAFRKIFWLILLLVSRITASAISSMIQMGVFQDKKLMLYGYDLSFAAVDLIYLFLVDIFVFLFLSLADKSFHMTGTEKVIFLILAVFFTVISEIIGEVQRGYGIREIPLQFLYVFSALLFFIFLFFIAYVYMIGLEREKYLELREQELLSRMELKQYGQIMASVEELRMMKHDMNHHLHSLAEMLKNRNYEEAENYLSLLTDQMEKSHYIVSSGNTPVDCILTSKLQEARECAIEISYMVHLPEILPVNALEICSLIGNILDNAIESCQNQEKESKRKITFEIKPYNDMMIISCVNSTNGQYQKDHKGNLRSTKKLKFGEKEVFHGLGIRRIESIAEEHGGFVDIQPEIDEFMISVFIPLQTSEKLGG